MVVLNKLLRFPPPKQRPHQISDLIELNDFSHRPVIKKAIKLQVVIEMFCIKLWHELCL
jgi:hypothetical protein